MICQRFENRQKIPDRNAFPQKILQYFSESLQRPRSFGVSSSTRTGLDSFKLLTRFCTYIVGTLCDVASDYFCQMRRNDETVVQHGVSKTLCTFSLRFRNPDGPEVERRSNVGIPVISSSTYPDSSPCNDQKNFSLPLPARL